MVQRSRAASALDWMALALVILAAAIALSGGLSVRLGGQRLTARSPDRALLAALAVVALRVALDRRTRPFAGVGPLARRVRDRVYVPGQDPVVPSAVPNPWRWCSRRGCEGVALARSPWRAACSSRPRKR